MHVVTIQTTLPTEAAVPGIEPEQWNDVPAASVDFEAARSSLKTHVSRLVEQLDRPGKE
jgi:hypothetical protein